MPASVFGPEGSRDQRGKPSALADETLLTVLLALQRFVVVPKLVERPSLLFLHHFQDAHQLQRD